MNWPSDFLLTSASRKLSDSFGGGLLPPLAATDCLPRRTWVGQAQGMVKRFNGSLAWIATARGNSRRPHSRPGNNSDNGGLCHGRHEPKTCSPSAPAGPHHQATIPHPP